MFDFSVNSFRSVSWCRVVVRVHFSSNFSLHFEFAAITMVYQVKDKADFDQKMEEAGGKLVVVDFFATWCGPCKLIAPQIEVMDSELPNVVFLKVDVDECEDLAAEYSITAMPTFLFFKDKKKVETMTGANAQKLQQLVTTLQ